jgi:O-antigen/teichoic acid export membrane protein
LLRYRACLSAIDTVPLSVITDKIRAQKDRSPISGSSASQLWPPALAVSSKASQLVIVPQRGTASLSVNFTWTLVGNAVYSGGQWVIVVLLAKLTRPELVGQYALGMAIVLPVIMLANLQLRWIVTTDVHEQRHFGDYLSFRLLSTALALVIIFASTMLAADRWQLRMVILMVGLGQAIEAISDVYYARLQLQDRMDRISKSMITRTLLSIIGLAGAVYFSRSLLWGVAAIALARAIVLSAYDIRGRTHDLAGPFKGLFRHEALKARWDLRVQRELLWLSLPLGIIAVSVSLNSSIPRYFIEHALGERALGIFSALAFMFAAGSMAVVSLGQSAFTRLARSYAAEDFVEFRSLTGKLLTMGATLGICGIILSKVAGREILAILFRPEYAEHANLLPWIMGAACITYLAQCLGIAMTAAGYYKPQVILFLLSNLAVGLGSYWLIPKRGLLGAIFAILISVLVQLAGGVTILVLAMRRHIYVSGYVCDKNVLPG